MARWAPGKRDTMRALAGELVAQHPFGRVVIAVTGGPGPGALEFGADLATELEDEGRRAFVADARAFEHDSGRVRSASAVPIPDPARLDETALRRALVDPFRLAGSTGFQTAVYDPVRGVPVVSEWRTAGPDAYLLVAGEHLLRPSLARMWNASVWVDAPWPAEAGADAEAAWARIVADGDPRSLASALVDARDPERPRRVFADAC